MEEVTKEVRLAPPPPMAGGYFVEGTPSMVPGLFGHWKNSTFHTGPEAAWAEYCLPYVH